MLAGSARRSDARRAPTIEIASRVRNRVAADRNSSRWHRLRSIVSRASGIRELDATLAVATSEARPVPDEELGDGVWEYAPAGRLRMATIRNFALAHRIASCRIVYFRRARMSCTNRSIPVRIVERRDPDERSCVFSRCRDIDRVDRNLGEEDLVATLGRAIVLSTPPSSRVSQARGLRAYEGAMRRLPPHVRAPCSTPPTLTATSVSAANARSEQRLGPVQDPPCALTTCNFLGVIPGLRGQGPKSDVRKDSDGPMLRHGDTGNAWTPALGSRRDARQASGRTTRPQIPESRARRPGAGA